jgi:cobalamin biosynthetic protein CobC
MIEAPEHGGDVRAASRRYGIAPGEWLDLSAALNPEPYSLPALPAACFQQLPDNEGLVAAARDYYLGGAGDPDSIVAAAGSQALIQALPLLRETCRVAVPLVGYREHAFRWRLAGHVVNSYDPRQPAQVDALLAAGAIDVLVVINPNNPLATETAPAQLQGWLAQLQACGGWLVVDEAFADASPQLSLAPLGPQAGLILLRSLGKFFGLAGMRCGFALCEPALARQLRLALGPWPVSGPAVLVAMHALDDRDWQRGARPRLLAAGGACGDLLGSAFRRLEGQVLRSVLFNSVLLPKAVAEGAREQLALQAIWVRLVELDETMALLRFGLVAPARQEQWRRFQQGLAAVAGFAAAQPADGVTPPFPG